MQQQTAVNYLIIGNGRMAHHFGYYLSLLNIPFLQWSRNYDQKPNDYTNNDAPSPPNNLDELLQLPNITTVFLLINDSAIENFINQHARLKNRDRDSNNHSNSKNKNNGKILIHFSGSLVTNLAFGVHPLMTFGNQLYSREVYEKICFVVEEDAPPFTHLLPQLNNPHFAISRELKPFYHALCVLSGNFTTLLWQKLFHEIEMTLKIPKTAAYPYLKQIFLNLLQDAETALTGPLARNDQISIETNLNALANDPYRKVYAAFVEAYREQQNQQLVDDSISKSTSKKTK